MKKLGKILFWSVIDSSCPVSDWNKSYHWLAAIHRPQVPPPHCTPVRAHPSTAGAGPLYLYVVNRMHRMPLAARLEYAWWSRNRWRRRRRAGDVVQRSSGSHRRLNITSDPETGAGSWTDDQLARAIREGIGHDGRALFPMMPYESLRHMSDEDLASLVVYIRSLPPVRNPLPKTEIIFPVKYLIRNVPQPVTGPVSSPDRSDRVKWGEYLQSPSQVARMSYPSGAWCAETGT